MLASIGLPMSGPRSKRLKASKAKKVSSANHDMCMNWDFYQ